MKVIATKIPEVKIIEPDVFFDNRGWFMETYTKQKYADIGIYNDFVQDNHSMSKKKGTLRGLHFQNNPMAQAKLVRCTRGKVIDVAVDLRKGSATYKQWVAVKLTQHNKRKLYIPRGFAHGFLTLTDNVEFVYKVDNLYSKEHERGIRFDDPDILITWNRFLLNLQPILSKKDINHPFLLDSDVNFVYGEKPL